MFILGLALITAGVLVIIYAMQGQSPFNLSPLTNGGEAAVRPSAPPSEPVVHV